MKCFILSEPATFDKKAFQLNGVSKEMHLELMKASQAWLADWH